MRRHVPPNRLKAELRTKRDRFPALTKEELQFLRAWVDQGAVWPKDVVLSPPVGKKQP